MPNRVSGPHMDLDRPEELTSAYWPVSSNEINGYFAGVGISQAVKPTKILANKTIKKESRYFLWIWIDMMNPCVQADSKYKADMSTFDRLIYIACDNRAKDGLKQAENNKTHTLMGDIQDDT